MDENTALRRKHHATCQSLFSSRPCMAHYTPLPQKRVFIEVRQRSKTLAALALLEVMGTQYLIMVPLNSTSEGC